jgi:hypothetical protein
MPYVRKLLSCVLTLYGLFLTLRCAQLADEYFQDKSSYKVYDSELMAVAFVSINSFSKIGF